MLNKRTITFTMIPPLFWNIVKPRNFDYLYGLNGKEVSYRICNLAGRSYFRMLLQYRFLYSKDSLKLRAFRVPEHYRRLFNFHRFSVRDSIHSLVCGFRCTLSLRGVGFKFSVQRNGILAVTIGFSHVINFVFPSSLISFRVLDEKSQRIEFCAFNREKLNAAMLQLVRHKWPDCYRGKGLLPNIPLVPTVVKEGKKKAF